jgi:hypothetical protein
LNLLSGKEWRGVVALIWFAVGLGAELAIERFVPPLVREYFSSLWIIAGWLGPSFILAIIGLRNGNLPSRICGTVVLIAFAVPVVLIISAGIQLTGR